MLLSRETFQPTSLPSTHSFSHPVGNKETSAGELAPPARSGDAGHGTGVIGVSQN